MKNKYFLDQCTPTLRELFIRVDQRVSVYILPSTIRTLEQQKEFFDAGTSKTMNSKHLVSAENPYSRAVDAGPDPFVWPQEIDINKLRSEPTSELKRAIENYRLDWARLYYFAGVVNSIAKDMGIKIRYGGDWDGDFDLKDQNFYDGVHFEEH
jgi:peptidoglycan L-alanyl-D-glutamate endopeptidase CwlK